MLGDLRSENQQASAGWLDIFRCGRITYFPAVVRFDEVERGMVEHAMRFTVRRSRKAYVYPATHFASRLTDGNLPRMGERFRLRADFDTSGFSPHAQAILKGLKKYGMMMADNGGDWRISRCAFDLLVPANLIFCNCWLYQVVYLII